MAAPDFDIKKNFSEEWVSITLRRGMKPSDILRHTAYMLGRDLQLGFVEGKSLEDFAGIVKQRDLILKVLPEFEALEAVTTIDD